MDDLIEKLQGGCIYRPKRWSGDTHDDLGGPIDEAATESLLAEAAEALEAALEDAQWRPIETAPRDGTRVLLAIEWSDVPVVGKYSHGLWWADTEHHEVSCGAYCYGGSVSSDTNMKPTHWRPLPKSPAIDAAIAEGDKA